MNQIFADYDKCTGCSACVQICPKSAITMYIDSEGFRFPLVDSKKCISCGVCKSVCTTYDHDVHSNHTNKTFACYSVCKSVREHSSSGGVFYEISSKIIKNGGFVCAAGYTENFDVAHKIVSTEKELSLLMKSKYIQSDINTTYLQIKDLLKNNYEVFFVGTPCQVYGLKKYLGYEYGNLLCADVVCHGVPSYKVFKNFVDEVSADRKLIDVDFRDKSNGWKNYSIKLKFDNNHTYLKSKSECLFFIGFVYNLYLRRSCYNCKFKNDNYYSDITLGDLWGAEDLVPQIDDDKGLSVFIAHTDKAIQVKSMLEDNVSFFELPNDDFLKYNPSIIESAKKNVLRKEFFNYLDKLGFSNTWDYIHTKSHINKLKLKIKLGIKRKIGTL